MTLFAQGHAAIVTQDPSQLLRNMGKLGLTLKRVTIGLWVGKNSPVEGIV